VFHIDKILPWQRKIILVVADSIIIVATVVLSFSFLLSLMGAISYLRTQVLFFGVFVGIRLVAYHWVGLYTFLWRYASTREFISIVRGSTLGSLLIALYVFFVRDMAFPRSILVIEWGFNILMVGSIRVMLRLYRDYLRNRSSQDRNTKKIPVVIIGAGSAGNQIAREIIQSKRSAFRLVGFIDDKQTLKAQRIHNVSILGTVEEIQSLAKKYHFSEALIAIPSASGQRVREIMSFCELAGIKTKILPGLLDVLGGKVSVSQFRDVRIDDLLRRDSVALDTSAISTYLSGEVVMVTGAGGSIGSELCRQILKYSPKQLLLIDHSEHAIYSIEMELKNDRPSIDIVPIVINVINKDRLDLIFKRYLPTIVFHAAAYKHVPLMELNVAALVHNNIKGTKMVFDLSVKYNVKNVVLISTDKAVNPTNCMGASKRVCEIMLQLYAQKYGTKFSAVRFGNVLGSQGSVIPLFKSQIQKGGPVTVTHPDITRYFMTIPEAVGLVIQTGALSCGGEIFILDMGDPVKIIDLAYDLIKLSGLVVDVDIKVEVTGLRPGEKMYEELAYDRHSLKKTSHQKIFVAGPSQFEYQNVLDGIGSLLGQFNDDQIRKQLFELIDCGKKINV
tara:strand:+ start:2112 stop:3962 length:1851 start_codon:yes stop_codon:yes gene_type:complete